jgi:hypothetical protein
MRWRKERENDRKLMRVLYPSDDDLFGPVYKLQFAEIVSVKIIIKYQPV